MTIRYPKGETIWVTYHNTDGVPIYFISSKPSREIYYLYEIQPDGSIKKLQKSKSPTDFDSVTDRLE